MTHSALGRAQLLHILARLPEAEWPAAAHAAGYEACPEPPKQATEPHSAQPSAAAPESSSASAPPYRPGDLPDLPFWRIASQRQLTPAERPGTLPDWLENGPIWEEPWESDPQVIPPTSRTLTPRARNARLLRRQLVAGGTGDSIDLARLCGLLAERRLPPRLPLLQRASWPGRVSLLLDLAAELTPYHADFWRWVAQLRQILGPRLTLLVSRNGHPGELERAGIPARLRLEQPPLVILSDAGLNAPDSPRQRHWRAFGQRCARLGVRPLLLAPAPLRRLTAETLAWCRCVLLEHGAQLHPLRRAGAAAAGHAEPLLAALASGAYTEPPLLRELRLAVAGQGADIGSEYEVWNHAGVIHDELACALRPDHRAAAEQALVQLPPALQGELQRLRQAGNLHLSPLVRLEETLSAGTRLAAAERAQALERARRYAATLHRAGGAAQRHPFAAYIAGMGRRRAELLAERPELALAWGLAHREQLQSGRLATLPKGLRLQDLAPLLPEAEHRRNVYLGQVGDSLAVYDPVGQGEQPLCRLAEAAVWDEYWQVEAVPLGDGRSLTPAPPPEGEGGSLPSPPGGRAGDEGAFLASAATSDQAPTPQTLHLDTPLTLDPAKRYHLTLGRQRLELEAVRRPVWAVGMGRDQDGLFAELAEGRRVYWVGKEEMWVAGAARFDGAHRFDGSMRFDGSVSFELPHGFWWDETEYRAWLYSGRMLAKPSWAVGHGTDDSGYWAEFEVKNVVQRLRWIPPGEFLMGSPKTEKERAPWGNDETQHPVLLTHGTWLADTACTQALWQAVLGKTPSNFKGGERPVEQVTWDDIHDRFLPALNQLVPGLDLGLPTEAQWEYACRAGTSTPFSFGENITTAQVNYNGYFPYADGEIGEHRAQTVAVRALPANAWGLYQMHGNVWEWCADWLGEYPREAVVDPLGVTEGRERVLRGGGWISDGRNCRSAHRLGYEPGDRYGGIGFRLARGPSSRQAASGGVAGMVDGGGAPASAPASPTRGQGGLFEKIFGKVRKK